MNSDRTTISLRLPRELHQTIAAAAGERGVNAAIVEALHQVYGAGDGSPPASLTYLDAIDDDIIARARVVARFQLAAAEKTNALDVVILDAELSQRIVAVVGDERRIHAAARRAIEAAFPAEGATWGQLAAELSDMDLSKSPSLGVLRDSIARRISENSALSKAIAP